MKYLFFVCFAVTFAGISADRVKRTPIKMSVYYEAHCSDSKDFILNQLHPHYCNVEDYVDLKLVPFGKAYSTGYSSFICQHGPEECIANSVHNCVLSSISNPKTQVDYLNCAMKNWKDTGHYAEKCVENNGGSANDIAMCYSSGEAGRLMLEAEVETKTKTPGPLFVPTIIFDEEYSNRDQTNAFNNFEATICEKLANHGYTDVCSNGMINNKRIC